MKRFPAKLIRLIAITTIIFNVLPGGCTRLPPNTVWSVTGTESPPQLAAFDKTMKEFMLEHEISAGALAVTYQGRLILAKGYTIDDATAEKVKPDSLFRIASISKPITSAAVLHLVEQGKLQLDEKITDILDMSPSPGRTADPRIKDVTILHLLEHLGGWDRDKSFDPMFQDRRISKELQVKLPIDTSQIIKFMNGQKLQHKPGTVYAYSNYGYCLLGRVIEKRTGMEYDQYVKQEILKPLQIDNMHLGRSNLQDRAPGEVKYDSQAPSPYGTFNMENLDAHGGWLSSAVDLARFAVAFDDEDNCVILKKESIERMFALPQNINLKDYKIGGFYYACGWLVRDYGEGKRNTWHAGSLPGTYTFMARWSSGFNCVALFNKRGKGIDQIDPRLGKTARSIKKWPQHDLFEKMLTKTKGPQPGAN